MEKKQTQFQPEKQKIWLSIRKSGSTMLSLWFFLLIIISNLNGQTILATEDFDGGGVGFSVTSDFNTGTGNNHFSTTDGSDISNVSGPYSFEGAGNFFFAAENTDDSAGNGADEQRLTTNSFSINGYSDIVVCIDMAAGNNGLGNFGTYDSDDYVSVQFNTDIQLLYIDALNYTWSPNPADPSDMFNQPLHHDVNRDGDGSDGPQLTTTAQNFCYTIPNIYTSDVAATMMSIRILVHMDANSEEIAFDNIVVSAPPSMDPPTITCGEFTDSGISCPNGHDPNTPNGIWNPVPASGIFNSSVGGGIVTGMVDLNGCVTDDVDNLEDLEYTLLASYIENNVSGCSKDIINEYQIRDSDGNISPTTIIFRGTITYTGPPPVINCPLDITVPCGSSVLPAVTGMATATTGCGTASVSYVDTPSAGSCDAIIRTWTPTDACGQVGSSCMQTISFSDNEAPTSSCLDPIEIFADFCPLGIGPGTPNGQWVNIPANGLIQVQIGPVHVLDLNCLTDNVSPVGDLQIRLASAQLIGTATSCLRVIESVYDIRDAAGNEAPNLVRVHYTLENDDPITHTPPTGLSCGDTFTMESQRDYVHTVTVPSFGGSSTNQDCRSGLIWATGVFETSCGDFTDFSISFSAESSPAPDALPDNMVFGGTSGNPIPDFVAPFGYIPASQYFYGSAETCSATTRVTYTLTDECGKTFTCFFLVEVTDGQDPIPMCNDIEVELVGGTYTLTQADEDAIGAGSSDNCGLNPALTGILPTTFTIADIGDNLVTYNVTDNCGNTAACVATVAVTCPLVLDCSLITDQNLECRSDLPSVDFSLVTAIDSCGDLTKSALTIIPGNDGCPGNPVIITRQYFVNDGVNQEECMQTFTIESTIPPTITCPADVTIQCDEDTSPVNTGMATGSASCSNFALNINFEDVSSQSASGCGAYNYVITRTWSATDGCGRVVTCDQIITVQDIVPPMITCPADVTVECDQSTDPGATGNAIASGDNCAADSELTITFSDVSTQAMNGCGNDNYTITRTWTATDPCGNTSQCDQIITVEDTTPPAIICVPNLTIECDEDTSPANTGMATGIDNCSALAEVVITFVDASTQGTTGCSQYDYSITRTWTATDACGNANTCSQIITVEDVTPPIISCPADLTIECDEDTSPTNTGFATGTDNCAAITEIVITSSDISTQGTVGCAKYDYTITRTWTASDACGNTSTCVQIISVNDTTSPIITCPANQTLACDTDPLPIANEISEFISIGGSAGDNCSNLDELTVSFSDNPPNQSMLNFCPGTPVADRTLTRTYTVTDICGNSSTCTQQFIYLESMNGPTITSVPPNQTVDCAVNAFSQLGLFTAEGDCSDISYSVSGPTTIGLPGCGGTRIEYVYTATDVCGRSNSHVQTYMLANDGPEFVCPTDICVIECPADSDMLQVQFDDYAELATVHTSCSETTVSITNSFNPNGFISQNCMNPTVAVPNAVAYQIVQFRATDSCGRNTTCTAMVVITDGDAPVITGNVSFGLADCSDPNLEQGYTDWATSQMNSLSATDGCSNGLVNFSYTPLVPNTDCSSGLASTEVSFIATDACGNTTVQTAFYRIIDNGTTEPTTATVSGNLLTEGDEMIALANVGVEGYSNNEMMTNEDGYYHFDLEMAQNYAITPSRNDDPLNGITTYDLILLGQHILDINSLDSPYKMIAADVNESGHISSLDMIELRRLILQIDSQFSSGRSWTFVEAAYQFPDPTNPFATTFPTSHNINNLTSSEIVDFIGVKLGDLNASANPSLLQTGDIRSSEGSLEIKLEDQLLKAGQRYELAFKASDFKEVAGFQFTLDFAPEYLKLMDYQSSKLTSMSANNFGFTLVDEGKIAVSWNETTGITLEDDETIFQFQFAALKEVQLAEILTINSSLTANEAYQADQRKEVALVFGQPISSFDKFTLFQNQPNPFMQETVIGFQLPEATEATVVIYDATGREVWRQTQEYEKGIHQVMVSKNELLESGVYYYRLSTKKRNATKKMIVLE